MTNKIKAELQTMGRRRALCVARRSRSHMLSVFVGDDEREAEDVTQRLAMFHPSDKAIRNTLADMGRWMERNEDRALTDIAADEPPLPEADVMVIGMDGANVLLRERGKKKGRPVERPTIDDSPDETKSCYKNAMTGTISYYATKRGSQKRGADPGTQASFRHLHVAHAGGPLSDIQIEI